jgi:hypothetical protein
MIRQQEAPALWTALLWMACTGPDPGTDTPSSEPTDGATDGLPLETDDTGDGGPDLGRPVTESFTYAAPLADVLFIVDASSSMWARIDDLVGTMGPTVSAWADRGIDYQVGVVDIDEAPTHGQLVEVGGYRWADASHPMPGGLLRQMIEAVGDPSTVEAGTLAAFRAIERAAPGGYNEGFVRDGSEVVFVVVTDESDQSDLVSTLTPIGFVEALEVLRKDPDEVAFHSIVATEDYVEISLETGGVVWNVDNTPYGPAIDAITDAIEPHNVFTLSAPAIPETLAVRVVQPVGEPELLDADDVDWDEDERTVDLEDFHPLDGAVVEITYVEDPG